MGKRLLLALAAVAAIIAVGGGAWYLRLTAPVEVSDVPPAAATLEVATPTAPSGSAPTGTPPAGPADTRAARLYRIDPGQSTASYRVDETFFDARGDFTAVGTTNAVAGDILLDPANLAASRVGEIVVDISQLRSDDRSRDNAIRNEWLESARYPLATFRNARLENFPAGWEPGQTLSFSMTGELTIRTTTRPVTWGVEATVGEEELRGRATTQVKMTDFGFQPPSLSALRVEDDVVLTLDFVARAVDSAGATGGAVDLASPTVTTEASGAAQPRTCSATPSEGGRPNYKPNAPPRSSVGEGHVLSGTIVSARDCAPLPGARLEIWLTNPAGAYDDDHRATVAADESGVFRFESNMPGAYGGGSPHMHMVASAAGHRDVVYTLVLTGDETESRLDFVLSPAGP